MRKRLATLLNWLVIIILSGISNNVINFMAVHMVWFTHCSILVYWTLIHNNKAWCISDAWMYFVHLSGMITEPIFDARTSSFTVSIAWHVIKSHAYQSSGKGNLPQDAFLSNQCQVFFNPFLSRCRLTFTHFTMTSFAHRKNFAN